MRNTGSLYGMLVMAVCLACATAVSLACLGAANGLSRKAYAQDLGTPAVQTIADELVSSKGGSAGTGATWFYDGDMMPCGPDAARYAVTAEYGRESDNLYTGAARLLDLSDDTVLIELPVAWTD